MNDEELGSCHSEADAETQRAIRYQLTHMLSRREHSQQECVDKLLQKGFDETVIWDVLSQFVAKQIQSDARFAYHHIRHAMHKGQGWMRIQQSLQAHRLASHLIEEALTELQPDWYTLAHQVKVKRFGESIEQDFALKQKQMRFLQYRGFRHEEIDHAVNYYTV
jgi:regulatory protein